MILIIVAHPDDESLWFGGTLLQLKENNQPIAIVSLTNANNEKRLKEFSIVCNMLRARFAMFDLPDGGNSALADFGPLLDQLLVKSELSPEEITCVITHAPDGNERQHIQHIFCHHHTKIWAKGRNIPLAYFSNIDPFELHTKKPVERVKQSNVDLYEVTDAAWIIDTPNYKTITSISAIISNTIDLNMKHELLRMYSSQFEGLTNYIYFQSSIEYCLFESMNVARNFIKLI